MAIDQERLAAVLTPAAPPAVVDDVYRDDEHERLLRVVQERGPWPTIVAHHFSSADELIATTTGTVPKDHGLTLDMLSTANFRGFYAENSICLHREVEDIFFSGRLLDLARDYWGAAYARPTLMLFNVCGPHQSGLNPHLDATTFRGVRIENTPVFLQNVMAKSGLFTEFLVNMTQVITWWYRGEHGTFTYWPAGPFGPPKVLPTPMWNRGVVVQNELMFHRGDPVGRPDERAIPNLRADSLLEYRPTEDRWCVTTDDEVVRTYGPEEMRFLVHWSCEVYRDLDEVKRIEDRSHELTHEQVITTLLADLRDRGIDVEEPTDPLHDPAFMNVLANAYTIAPTTDWLVDDTGATR